MAISKEKYLRPKEIENDMGGHGDQLDDRMQEIFTLLKYAPKDITELLDVGMGQGQIVKYFASQGVRCTGTGLEMESYGINAEEWKRNGIDIVECPAEKMPFESDRFDCIVASHVIEHLSNTGLALQEFRRCLKDNGWLLVFVPEFSDYVCAGHINTGWNIGQLIYVLLLNGFDVKHGHFIHYGYSICAYVRKANIELPPIRGDRGDIYILDKAGLFPFSLNAEDSVIDGWPSRSLKAVNWENAEELLEEYYRERNTKKSKLIDCFIGFMSHFLGKEKMVALGYRMIDKDWIVNP